MNQTNFVVSDFQLGVAALLLLLAMFLAVAFFVRSLARKQQEKQKNSAKEVLQVLGTVEYQVQEDMDLIFEKSSLGVWSTHVRMGCHKSRVDGLDPEKDLGAAFMKAVIHLRVKPEALRPIE